MSEDVTQGMFLCRTFKSAKSDVGMAFFKPTNILIFTAPAPIGARLVCYEMAYWEGSQQPSAENEWRNFTRYVSPINGQTSFSFTIKPAITDLDEILSLIRKNFYDVVMRGERSMDTVLAFETYMCKNLGAFAEMEHNVHHVHHLQRYALVDGKQYVNDISEIRYLAGISDIHSLVLKQFNRLQYTTTGLIFKANADLGMIALKDHIRRVS